MLADRAFLRCQKGTDTYKLHCPSQLRSKQYKQKHANDARKITLFRHTVERSFGRRKQMWGILDRAIPHQLLANGQFTKIYKILAAIDNAFCKQLFYDKPEHDIQLRNIQQSHLKNATKLSQMINNRPKGWEECSYELLKQRKLIPDFNISQLTPTVCSVYAYNLSKGYLNKVEKLSFATHPDLPTVIKVEGT